MGVTFISHPRSDKLLYKRGRERFVDGKTDSPFRCLVPLKILFEY